MGAMLETKNQSSRAFHFVVLIGFVSLFADMAYEGAHGINGQFLGVLGSSTTVVGAVAGLGEFAAYGSRFLADHDLWALRTVMVPASVVQERTSENLWKRPSIL